ncbi:unnamed protein product [Closterium sp. Yama58-4]|nr:unnamed protein product [Closterium sp. Yama58-4]
MASLAFRSPNARNRAITAARSERLELFRLASLREHLAPAPAAALASSHGSPSANSSRANGSPDSPSRRHSSASHPPPPSFFPSASHHNHPSDSGSPASIRSVVIRSSPQPAPTSSGHHHYYSSRALVPWPSHRSVLPASSALISRLLHSSRAVTAVGSEPPVAGERSGLSSERAAGGEESVGDLRVSYGGTAEAEGEEAERRGNINDGREEGRGRVWNEVREEGRKAEAQGGVALADGEKAELRTRQRRVRMREEPGGEWAAGGGTAEEGGSREDEDEDDMSGYGVASAEDLRNAKQIADAILSGRFFAGMSRGKRHWAGDDAGESGGEDGGVGERGGGRKERRGDGRGEGRGEVGGDDEEEEEEWRRSFRERGWRPGFRGLGDWLGEAGGAQAEAEGQIPVEKQRFARVALVGAPNAGKSALMNRLVGMKVSAVSRKTNTTQREVVGIRTTGPTQLVFHDTPGLTVALPSQPLSASQRQGSLLASSAALHCNVVALVIDADRQIRRPDPRVRRLVGMVGAERREGQQRIAVLNKVDLVKDKRLLLPLSQELSTFHSIERVFMVSALQDKGVNLLEEYLFDHAVQAAWEEDPRLRTDQSPEQLAMQIVRELLLHRMHQEVPYAIEHRHVSCSVLRDGSLRIEQLLLVHSNAQRAMLVGKAGQVVRSIGREARYQLQNILGGPVHLILQLGEITADKLAEYNGSDSSKPILVSLKHVIYDVTSASSFYGPDGPYSIFAGRDASRSLATMTMDEVGGSLDGLTEKQLKTLDDWVETFARKYPVVGTLV